MPSSLYLVNLPHNCTDNEVRDWVEAHGFPTCSIRIIRDVVAGVSPAFGYAQLQDESQVGQACAVLTGEKLGTSRILVTAAEEPRRFAASA
jgi:RNA recognition motif-containing protein